MWAKEVEDFSYKFVCGTGAGVYTDVGVCSLKNIGEEIGGIAAVGGRIEESAGGGTCFERALLISPVVLCVVEKYFFF